MSSLSSSFSEIANHPKAKWIGAAVVAVPLVYLLAKKIAPKIKHMLASMCPQLPISEKLAAALKNPDLLILDVTNESEHRQWRDVVSHSQTKVHK